ncbi:tRNA pseudouridine(38-40) synthase TruA [Neorickettsia sp. 179522]|uniref:tRNA pseudouridine(38-40) synthase TruA n=1 Tax=Neorickettsia sp. 179522 TaxID=1714371 RepID=UPI00079300FD|nr:tRNA pseudouridine(38-40) synthase TruA [Neorickettsia sp. 179522]KYH12226.1 pseudouridine synthase [Neorickettsia sp. 179522]
MRYKATVEYVGTGFSGWQRQMFVPSVQEELESVLSFLLKEKIAVSVAGRTDAGVHALGQVFHFDVRESALQPFQIVNAVNYHLKEKLIVLLSMEVVDETFDARFSAIRRHYQYRIINRKTPLAVFRNRCWHVPWKLDLDFMREQAQCLVGRHDFQSFRSSKCGASNAIRTLDRLEVEKNGEEIIFYASAKSFLHHQVRIMVGTLVAIASGKLVSVTEILSKRNRCCAGPTAPPCGLYFLKVDY